MFTQTTQYAIHLIRSFGYLGIFLGMTLESVCFPVPSEVIIPFAGYLAWLGDLSLFGVVVTGTLGNVAGSLIVYCVGIRGGRPILEKYGRYIYVSDKHITAVDNWFARRGDVTILLARVLPGIRGIISLPAGISRMPIDRFVVFTTFGVSIWVFTLSLLGFDLGREWNGIHRFIHLIVSFTHPLINIVTETLLGAIVLLGAVALLQLWRTGHRKSHH